LLLHHKLVKSSLPSQAMPCPVQCVVFAFLVVQGTSLRDPMAVKDADEVKTIVVDISDTIIKAGFAGDKTPKITFPFVFGDFNGNRLVGNDALNQRPQERVQIEYPSAGLIDSNGAEAILQYIFNRLAVDVYGSQMMLIVSPACHRNPYFLAPLLFDKFEFEKVMLVSAMPVALASVGLESGLGMLLGGGPDSFAQPIWAMTSVPDQKVRLDVSGKDMVTCEDMLLKESPATESLKPAREIQRAISAFWAGSPRVQLDASKATDVHTRCPEVFFQPSMAHGTIKGDAIGIHDAAFKSILGTDKHVRKEVASNIVVFGSYSGIPGLKERLQKEIHALLPADATVNPQVSQGDAWTGGSQLIASGSGSSHWISKDMYYEKGTDVVRIHWWH